VQAQTWWQIGGQFTGIGQTNLPVPGAANDTPGVSDFTLGPKEYFGRSAVVTAFGALRAPWRGGSFVIMPEYSYGRGLPHPTGMAGYPDGDMVRVSAGLPYVARVFFHQSWSLCDCSGEVTEAPDLEDRFSPYGAMWLGRVRSMRRLDLTVGKFAANDFLDVSESGSDPHHHFFNWALMAQGAWDYAADVRGYTWGAILDLEEPRFAVRGGVAMMPTVANGGAFDLNVQHSRSEMVEGEYRWSALRGAGSAKLLAFLNHANAGSYTEAAAMAMPDITAVRHQGALKYGGGLLVNQEIGPDVNAFFRAGWNDGKTETFVFTEIDRSLSIGGDLSGRKWRRPADRVAFAVAVSGLSDEHRKYLEAGGHGFQITGAGQFSYAPETIFEAYYLVRIDRWIELTVDAQLCVNPGMNSERGPIEIFGLRLHAHY
jgi:high affinity Mn2+ porin